MEQAQAELTIIGQRAAAAHPETHARLRPIVLPYTREFSGLVSPARVWMVRVAQLLIGALAFVVAVNLAILMYARTVTRLGEIAVRTALGASRRRILAQLFIEALALTVVGAAAGLVLAQIALGRMQSFLRSNGTMPFWIDYDLSVWTVMYALGLAVLAAVIMGVLPGLKATGSGLTASLHELTGRSGTRLGPMWTALVVAQIAVAVAVLPWAVYLSWQLVQREVAGPGFAVEEFVVGMVVLGDEASTVDSNHIRRTTTRARVASGGRAWCLRGRVLIGCARICAEPPDSIRRWCGCAGCRNPGGQHSECRSRTVRRLRRPDACRTSLQCGRSGRRTRGHREPHLRAGVPGLFDKLRVVPTLRRCSGSPRAGRGASEVEGRAWSRDGHQQRIGPPVPYPRAPTGQPAAPGQQEWYQIIGVVRDFPSFPPAPLSDGEPTVYHPAAPGDIYPVELSVRFNGAIPAGVAERFRQIGAEVDPALQLRRVVPLSEFYDQVRSLWRYMALGIGAVTISVLLLSAAGIYALMSFTVAQRTREIGIRAALGANPRRILLSIFGRVMRQLALGLLVGSLLSVALFSGAGFRFGRMTAFLLAVAALMLIVGLLAALGPARRSLRIQAIEALRADG